MGGRGCSQDGTGPVSTPRSGLPGGGGGGPPCGGGPPSGGGRGGGGRLSMMGRWMSGRPAYGGGGRKGCLPENSPGSGPFSKTSYLS